MKTILRTSVVLFILVGLYVVSILVTDEQMREKVTYVLLDEQIANAALCATVTYHFASGTLIKSSEVNKDFGDLIACVDSIDNDKVASGAGIVDTKLATISTTNKVEDTALFGTEWTDLTDGGITALHTHNITGTINGDLAIGTDTPHARLHVVGCTVANAKYHLAATTIIEDCGTNYLQFMSPSTPPNMAGLIWGNTNDSLVGAITYYHVSNSLIFVASSTTVMTTTFATTTFYTTIFATEGAKLGSSSPLGVCAAPNRLVLKARAIAPGVDDALYMCGMRAAGTYGWGTVTVTF